MKFILIMASALSFYMNQGKYPDGECVRLFDTKDEMNQYLKEGKVPESCSLENIRVFEAKELKAKVKMKVIKIDAQVPDGVTIE